MSYRKEFFTNGQIYHIYNKTIDHINIFNNHSLGDLFLDLLCYYRSQTIKLRYSRFLELEIKNKKKLMQQIKEPANFKIEIFAYILMPNHFHLLLKQKKTNGIVRFMSDTLNSFTRTHNSSCKRLGPIFLPKFKSKRISSEEQLIHTSRYIHLNPYSSGLIKNVKDLKNYQFSSFKEYLNRPRLCYTQEILALFKEDEDSYNQFVLNNAEHQKTLEIVKHFSK